MHFSAISNNHRHLFSSSFRFLYFLITTNFFSCFISFSVFQCYIFLPSSPHQPPFTKSIVGIFSLPFLFCSSFTFLLLSSSAPRPFPFACLNHNNILRLLFHFHFPPFLLMSFSCVSHLLQPYSSSSLSIIFLLRCSFTNLS